MDAAGKTAHGGNGMTRGELPKRLLDLAVSAPLLIMIGPLLLALAAWVRLDSPGPGFYRRRVMARGGGQFDAFKLRTMRIDGDAILAQHPERMAELQRDQKLRDDPRVTRVGLWLRRFSLDELPQLANVVRGEMSLVGPRMIIRSELSRYGDDAGELLSVKPGMTGLWQVSGRGDVQGDARARVELEYVRQRTFWLDVKLLVQTVPAVFGGRGAR
jgi:lipopolysaccharide/colanic/teichoic acid biosynthesis glycosyltransferase